jgi:hypothetical protein
MRPLRRDFVEGHFSRSDLRAVNVCGLHYGRRIVTISRFPSIVRAMVVPP